jgi:hypothetical protein
LAGTGLSSASARHLGTLGKPDLCQATLLPEKSALDFPGETFRVLKEKEERLYGEYGTRRLVLEAWDALEDDPAGEDGHVSGL